MEKEFVPYEQTLELEHLGFNNKEFLNFAFVDKNNKFYTPKQFVPNNGIWTPLYQQAFRWFREKHDLHHLDLLSLLYLEQKMNYEE